MATIETRKTGSGNVHHHVKIRIRGHAPVTATFDRLTDAKRWASKTEADIRAGRHLGDQRVTLKEAFTRYENEVYPDRAVATVQNHKTAAKFWIALLGDRSLSKITAHDIAAGRDKLLAEGMAPGTVVGYLRNLSAVFAVAVKEWGIVEVNPCSRVRKPTQPPGRVRFLDDGERQRLLDACRASSHEDLYDIVLMAVCSGMRKMEILDLTWRDVDLTTGAVTITADRAKTRRSRTVPLAAPVLEMLRNRPRDSIRVFSTHPRRLDRAFVAAREAAGIKSFVFHDLRHSAASYLAASGASLHEISIVLGHSSVVMSQRYSHLTQDHVRAVVERMNQRIIGK